MKIEENLAENISLHFHPAQHTLIEFKSQDLPEVYSQNDSMPQRIYFSVLSLYKGKIYF